ncbi:MAG: NB-ARC domain-containing protein, partial [Dolichospermum sp.]
MHFVGRETELITLHEDLQRGDYVAISGMGGLGKTELAIQYAKKYENDYGGITWLNGRGNNLAAEVLNFFISHFKLEIPQQQGDKLLTLQEQVAWCWLQYPHAEKPILIICDDVTELAQLQENVPNNNRFRVLITTRTQNLDPNYIQSIQLKILPENQALELLQKSLGNQDKRISRNLETAKEICKCLEYLPLGIILVAGYLLNDPGLSLAKMLAELQQRKLAA